MNTKNIFLLLCAFIGLLHHDTGARFPSGYNQSTTTIVANLIKAPQTLKKLLPQQTTSSEQKRFLHQATGCLQMVAGRLVDVCTLSGFLEAVFIGAIAQSAKDAQYRQKENRYHAQIKYVSHNAAQNYNISSLLVDVARREAYERRIKMGKEAQLGGVFQARHDKVYTYEEVRQLRAQGVTDPILTVDECGKPCYDEVSQKNTSNDNNMFADPYNKQGQNKQNTKNFNGGAAAGGSPQKPPEKPWDPKDKKSEQNKERKQNTPEERHGAMKELRGEFKMKQGTHSIYNVAPSQAKSLAEASGAKIAYISADKLHNEIEVWDKNGRHLGAIDPVTKKFISGKDRIPKRDFKV